MTATATGWVKTLNGDDVYTEDGEWFFGADSQGWFYAPDLLTMPAAPADVRRRSLARRILTNWPRPSGIWALPRDWFARYVFGVPLRAALVYIWCYQYLILIGPLDAIKAFARNTVGFFMTYHSSADPVGAWWNVDDTNEEARLFLLPLIFLGVTVFILALMYVHHVIDVDPVKGVALATGITLAVAYRNHQARQSEGRIREQGEAWRRYGGSQ